MNKTQLVDAVAEIAELPKAKISTIVESILQEITRVLSAGEPVVLVGFGTFSVKKRAARVGRDPRTGGALQIPEAMIAGFKAGKSLKDSVNTIVAG